MPISYAVLLGTALCASSAAYGLQFDPALVPGHAKPAQNTTAVPVQNATQNSASGASGILQPALDSLDQTLSALKVDKWKGGSVRTEASANISSIMRDLQSTLPALLKEADAAPGTMSKVLPVSRNVDALYDVVLRVFDGASIAAPGDQLAQLQQAMAGLGKARHALDDRIEEMAAAEEKHTNELQIALKTQAAPVVCPVAPAPAPAPAAKKPAPKKRKPKPATTPPASTTPSTTAAKPNQ
jgi:uncharacterized protein YukE